MIPLYYSMPIYFYMFIRIRLFIISTFLGVHKFQFNASLSIKLKGQWENRKYWGRGRLTHQGQCCSAGNFICCLKWTHVLWSSIILPGSVWLPKRGLFSTNSQNKNHYRNKMGRQDVCSQALIHANMHENAIRGGSELRECVPDDMQISFPWRQPPDARWLIDYTSSYHAANYLGWSSLI